MLYGIEMTPHMKQILILFFTFLLISQSYTQENDYQKNLKIATHLFLAKSDLPDSVLLKLIPKNNEEFSQFYYTTTITKTELEKAGFFYLVTQQIFDKVIKEKNERFYLPSLQLASFADGEYAELFIPNLEQ